MATKVGIIGAGGMVGYHIQGFKQAGAEIVAIEVDFGGTKFIFCTCYRVGTLGPENHESFSNSVCSDCFIYM